MPKTSPPTRPDDAKRPRRPADAPAPRQRDDSPPTTKTVSDEEFSRVVAEIIRQDDELLRRLA